MAWTRKSICPHSAFSAVKSASMLSSLAPGLRFGDARYYNISLEAAKPMSDIALDSFNRRPRYTLSFSYQL